MKTPTPINEQISNADKSPMHDGEIQAAWLDQGINEQLPYAFVLGIRAAERFNGILKAKTKRDES